MKRQLSQKFIKELREFYAPGTRVKLIKMDDIQAPPVGTIGVVSHVDDIGTIHVDWENGSTLGVVFAEDEIESLDSVITICYHKKQVWINRQDAIDFFHCGMCNSEGSEKERYTNIYTQLLTGKNVCRDTNF